MRSKFDEQLNLLNTELIRMGAFCEESIETATKALLEDDLTLAGNLAELEKEIKAKEKDIETLCLKLILQQQPVARDLRQISAALKMITDMERIGGQAADVAEIIGYLDGRRVSEFKLIGDMACSTGKMVKESIDAFVKRDAGIAQAVIAYDDVVDDLFVKVKKSLIVMINKKPEDGEYAIDLLMIAKYFERIGDHAVNVAQWVLFSVTGIHKGEPEQ